MICTQTQLYNMSTKDYDHSILFGQRWCLRSFTGCFTFALDKMSSQQCHGAKMSPPGNLNMTSNTHTFRHVEPLFPIIDWMVNPLVKSYTHFCPTQDSPGMTHTHTIMREDPACCFSCLANLFHWCVETTGSDSDASLDFPSIARLTQ